MKNNSPLESVRALAAELNGVSAGEGKKKVSFYGVPGGLPGVAASVRAAGAAGTARTQHKQVLLSAVVPVSRSHFRDFCMAVIVYELISVALYC